MAFLVASILSGLGVITSLIRGSEHKQRTKLREGLDRSSKIP